MNQTFKNTILSLFIISFMILPVISFGQETDEGGGLVPCGNAKTPLVDNGDGTQSGGDIVNPCGINDLFKMINTIVNFMLFVLALPLAAIMFAYAGFLFMFSGVMPEQRSKAKGIFWNVFFGLVIAAAAWLIINTILSIIGFKGDWTSLNF